MAYEIEIRIGQPNIWRKEKGSKTKMLSALQRCRHFACASNAFIFSAFAEMQTTKQMRAGRAQQTLDEQHWIKYLNGQVGFT